MYSTTPPTHTDPPYGNTIRPSVWLHYKYQESDMYSTTPPTHTGPQYGYTTSTKILTCTPLHHQPTLTLSMVTPPVPKVGLVLPYTTIPHWLSVWLHHQYQSLTCTPLHHQFTLPTHTSPQYGYTTSIKSLTCTPLHHQTTLTLSMLTQPVRMSLTFTPLHHQPTLTLSMVTPPVPESDIYSTTPPTNPH